jgi:5-methylcytosine-specific restriction endonuclease McrA
MIIPCSKCGVPFDRNTKRGQCKDCRTAYERARLGATKRGTPKGTRFCRVCKVSDQLANRRICQECNLDRKRTVAKAWREANPEEHKRRVLAEFKRNPVAQRARYRKWAKAHPEVLARKSHDRRALKLSAAGSYTDAEWKSIVRKQKGRCALCHIKCKLTVDHVIPLKRGGTNFAFNLQGLCMICNVKKNARIEAGAQHSLFDRQVAA